MATYVSKQGICKYIDEGLNTNCLTVYEASIILRWMLGQTPQRPNKAKLGKQNNRVLRNAMRLTIDSGVLNWINGVLDVDPGYLCLHHNKMQANWHQDIECTSMRVGKLNNNLSLKGVQRNIYLGSV
uniref:Late blight resistance protein n=1 Tax=Solanum tuberosum TaxID=4113 RepID=M1DPS4_SOLTU